METKITINNWCKNCGICVAFCPSKVFEFVEGKKPVVKRIEKCTSCLLCVLRCPDFAIEVKK